MLRVRIGQSGVMPSIAGWSLLSPAGDAVATLEALASGRAQPGRLPGELLGTLEELGRQACAGSPPDLVILATAKGDLPLWSEAVLPGGDRRRGGPAWLAAQLAECFACPAIAIGAACASGPIALAEAARTILAGDARRVLVLGGDRLAPFVEDGFAGLKAIDPLRCRPFDANRAGIVLGESAAALVLSADSGAWYLQGWGHSLDASHMTGPARDGGGLARACRMAMTMAPDQWPGLIIAHGTGTRANDDAESQAYASAVAGVPVVGWKGGMGHSLGACGLSEAVLAVAALAAGRPAPGTIGCRDLGVPGPITVLPAGSHQAEAPWLSANAGFGGMNGVVLIGRSPAHATMSATARLRRRVEATVDGWRGDGDSAVWGPAAAAGRLPRPSSRQATGTIDPSWGRMDAPCRLLVALARTLQPWPAATHIVLLSDSGCLLTDAAFEAGRRAGMPDFQTFAYTLASSAIGEASIRLGIQGGGQVVQGISDTAGRRMAGRIIAAGAPAVLLARIETGNGPETAWIERIEPAAA